MNIQEVFWNSREHRLRALWRLVVQAAMLAALGIAPIIIVAEPLTMLHHRGLFLAGMRKESYDRIINMIVGPLFTVAVVTSVVIAARWLDHRPLSALWVRFDRKWWRGLGFGAAIGALLMTLVFGVEWLVGWITPTGVMTSNVPAVPFVLSLSFSSVKILCVGTYEEFLSRGYHLRNLTEGTTLAGGVVLSSAIFALLHLGNENSGIVSTTGLFVNALLFVAAVLITGRLSTAIGLHITWNFFQGAVFGFPVSGDKEGASFIGINQGGPDLLTGGAFGPEAGFVGIAASLLGIGLLMAWRRYRGQLGRVGVTALFIVASVAAATAQTPPATVRSLLAA